MDLVVSRTKFTGFNVLLCSTSLNLHFYIPCPGDNPASSTIALLPLLPSSSSVQENHAVLAVILDTTDNWAVRSAH